MTLRILIACLAAHLFSFVGAETAPAPLLDKCSILDQAHRLVLAHDDAGAAQVLEDYFESSRSVPALLGVRNSYIISEWACVAATYPPARSAALALRDRDSTRLLAGDDIPDGRRNPVQNIPNDLFIEIASIDEHFGENAHAVTLFIRLDEQKPHLAWFCFAAIRDRLFAVGKNELCLKYIGDPLDYVKLAIEVHASEQAFEQSAQAARMPAEVLEAELRYFRHDMDFVVSVLAESGKLEVCHVIGQNPDLMRIFPGWTVHVDRLVERHRDF